jgi:hypothetical protein
MIKRIAWFLLAAAQASAVAAQEGSPSIRPVLELVSYTGAHLKYCQFADPPGDAQETFDAALSALSDSLAVRAIAIGKNPEDVPKGISDYIALITREPPNLAEFVKSCPSDINQEIDLLKSSELQEYLAMYRSLPVTYDKPFTVSGSGVESYADASTQQLLLDTIRGNLENCPDFQLVSIVLDSKSVDSGDNLPVFVAPNIKYTETWGVKCGDQPSSFKITHARDSEGANGLYSVEGQAP